MSGVSRALQSAKSILRKIPGSGSVERLFDRSKSQTGEIDIEKVARFSDANENVNQISKYAPTQMTPAELEEICNISRIHKRHRLRVTGQLPPLPDHDYANAVVYHRKRYARYGAASNIDPRKLWPTESELETVKEVAALRHPNTVEDVLKIAADVKAAELKSEADARARDEELDAMMPKMELMKEKIYTDALKLDEEMKIAEEKRNKRIEQVRRFFEYTLDVKDPRFKEKMVEMIQSEKDAQKKKTKEAKKLRSAEQKAKLDAAKAEAVKARREAKAKADAESSDDE